VGDVRGRLEKVDPAGWPTRGYWIRMHLTDLTIRATRLVFILWYSGLCCVMLGG